MGQASEIDLGWMQVYVKNRPDGEVDVDLMSGGLMRLIYCRWIISSLRLINRLINRNELGLSVSNT